MGFAMYKHKRSLLRLAREAHELGREHHFHDFARHMTAQREAHDAMFEIVQKTSDYLSFSPDYLRSRSQEKPS